MSSEEEIAKKLKQGVEEEKQILGRFGFALWIIAILVGAYFVTMILLLICGQIETAGQFGDSFGAVTSLLTGVSVFAIVYTLHLQRKDLNTQRESLMLQIKEMSDTRAELERQTKQLVRSANESKRAADADH